MLSLLTVKNFAIIDNLTVEFDQGLTILTGETGAGKSLIIDAIGLLLGQRATSSMIRSGQSKAVIEGVFIDLSPKAIAWLDSFGLNEDEPLVIRRELNENGKSFIRVNGSLVSLSQVEELGGLLADIHTQGDSKRFFESGNYLEVIDDQMIIKEKGIYQKLLANYKGSLKSYLQICKQVEEDQKEFEYLKYRYEELEKADLKIDEIIKIENELNDLRNYDQIYKNLSVIKQLFSSQNIVQSLYEIKNQLAKLSDYSAILKKYQPTVDNCYYELDDFENEVVDVLTSFDFDEDHLNQLQLRLNQIQTLMRKYQLDLPQLIADRDNLRIRLDNFENSQFVIDQFLTTLNDDYQLLKAQTIKLTELRKSNAKVLENSIKEALKELCLPNVTLKIEFNDYQFKDCFDHSIFKPLGADIIDLKISFNPGESLKSLGKVASGGEMSRVMLAIKTYLLTNSQLSTMIFDEIDTGVSGEVGLAMALKLKLISQKTQVLAITHLPIVASAGDHHYHISKKTEDGLTISQVEVLDDQDRIKAIAKMISSQDDDKTSQELASTMIKNLKTKN